MLRDEETIEAELGLNRPLPLEWSARVQYGLALGLAALSLASQWSLGSSLGLRIYFLLSLGTLLPLVLLVRPRPFLSAIFAGWLGAWYFLVPAPMSFVVAEPVDASLLISYAGVLGLAGGAAWVSRWLLFRRQRYATDTAREEHLRGEVRVAEAKFRTVFDQSGIFAGITDLDGTVREANDCSLTACGYRADQVIGRKFRDGPWWGGSEAVQKTIDEATAQAAGGVAFRDTLPYWLADGRERAVELSVLPVRDRDGRVVFLHPTGIDITERMESESLLRRSHDTFFKLIENAPFGIFIIDSGFRLRQVSAGARKVFENIHPLLDRDFSEVLACVWEEPFLSEALEHFRHTLATGERYMARNTTEKRRDLGEVESYDWRIERITLPDGSFGVVCHFYDLSDINRAHEELRYRSTQFETLLNQAPMGVYLVDADFRLAQINPIAWPVFQNVPGPIGHDCANALHIIWGKEFGDEVIGIFRHTLETGESHHAPELAQFRADEGALEYYEWRVDRITLPDGRYGAVCYFRDISDMVRARHAIAESEARYRLLFESMDEAFCVLEMIWDDDGRPVDFRYLEINPAFKKQTGLQGVVGKRATEVLDHESGWFDIYGEIARTGGSVRFEHRAEALGRWFDVNAFRIGDPAAGRVAALFSDITERKKAEDALRVQEEQLRTAKSAARLGLHNFDIVLDTVNWDERTRELWGVEPDEPISFELWRDSLHPDDREPAIAAVQHALDPAGDGHYFAQYRVTSRRDNVTRWIEVTGTATFVNGKAVRLVGTVQDISEVKRAEEALQHRATQFETLLSAAPIGIYLVDADFRMAQLNPVAQGDHGRVPGGPVGRDFAEVMNHLWPPDFATEVIRIFRHTLETGEPVHVPEAQATRTDTGAIEFYDWRVDRITLPDGRFGVVCYYIDISEQVRTRRTITESEERYRTLFESIDEGFCIIEVLFDEQQKGVDYRFLEVNPAFEAQAGIKNAMGRRMRELAGDEDAHWFELYGRVALTGEPIRYSNYYPALRRWFDVYAFRVGAIDECKVAVLFTNITPRKEAEEALARARKELQRHAEKLERRVTERTEKLRETVAELEHFSYTITHDMRAPLRAMQAFSQILREDYESRLDEQGIDFLRRINEAASRMDSLITDSLNYAKAVQTELILEPVEPGRLLRGMIESYPHFQSPRAEIEVAENLPPVLANQAGLTQCFSNLLGNAVKFVPAGTTPFIRIWAEEHGDIVRVWVEDNGVGIPEDQQDRVFVMFQRLNKHVEGTGVGLALVRKVVERMRGKVGLESAPGGGCLFWIELQKAPR
jgi:PAS domain S-box-containing protein